MAAVVGAIKLPVHDVAQTVGIDLYPVYDVEIVIYGGLDPQTDELVNNARKAAAVLREEYGIEVIVSPNIVHWDVASFTPQPYMLPVLVINGREVSEGRVLSVQEIVDIVLKLFDEEKGEHSIPPIKKGDNAVEVTACTW